MLQEYHSRHLNVPYVYIRGGGAYLCSNGVLFTKEEYLKGIDLKAEYERRAVSGELYDYDYARRTGMLRLKPSAKSKGRAPGAVAAMCMALLGASAGSMVISTLHTATYLLDYTDAFSAWLMSAVITVYCSAAFEVVLLFADRKRRMLAAAFGALWAAVLLFSMATTVSVFYDRFNASQVEAQEASRGDDGARLKLDALKSAEAALRGDIEFKRRDIEYRQARDYATAAVRLELERLQSALQRNIAEQAELVSAAPASASGGAVRREGVYALLSRATGVDPGLLEFAMSALAAVFINIISPLSVSVAVSFLGGMKNEGD